MTRDALLCCLALLLASCASWTDDLRGVAELPPLDRAVMVSGGAFFAPLRGATGTFAPAVDGAAVDADDDDADAGAAPDESVEAIPFDAVLDVLRRGEVFQRVDADRDPARRKRLRAQLQRREGDPELEAFLEDLRVQGYDLLLLIEELQDGPIERQGTNGRWPVTFVTWILLGVGAWIPDHTFESRATLRVSMRELQTGRELHNLLLVPGPVELSLTERTDFWGLLMSLVVPPFWVGDDDDAVTGSVRATTERRLLLSLARDLKSEVVRRRLAESGAANIELRAGADGLRVTVESRETLSVARLTGPGLASSDAARAFEAELLRSRTLQGGRFRYRAALPDAVGVGPFQVRVGTLRGGVASSTFTRESAR